ncbi:MAG: GNAT family N-acetyltransferase [Legionellales bacterium]|nr:GNAT family N-acetyltransferase [Legionellales bacterium]
MREDYTLLEFDSTLFGYVVASIKMDEKNFQSLSQIVQKMKLQNVRLAYLQLPSVNEDIAQFIEQNGGKLVDEKVHIKWQLSSLQAQDTSLVAEYTGEYTDELKTLFRQSGVFSRFALDESFVNGEFNKLYDLWGKQALSPELGGKMFIYPMPNGQIAGFAMREYRGEQVFFGQMAVDSQFRGKGIGRALLAMVKNSAYLEGCEELHGIVHRINSTALALHKPYEEVSSSTTFHFWL